MIWFNAILFLLNMLWIFTSEGVFYIIFHDYEQYIERITMKLASMNILYVKIFQAFALNQHLIDNRINQRLLKFTDQAPWTYDDIPFTELMSMVKQYNIELPDGYYNPINAGMISLVFKGYERDCPDKPVIIKVKRKHIQQTLEDAIDTLLCIVDWLSMFPLFGCYQIAEVIRKNAEIVRHQTNFLEEVDNMNRIRENCKHLKYVVIPQAKRVITENYPDIIVMNYIDGMKLGQISTDDYESFAKLVVKFGLVTSMIHGVTHGDLHGGNILFIRDMNDCKTPHKIGVIDFGIIYEIHPKYKSMMFDIFTQFIDAPPRESAEKILCSGIIEPPDVLRQIPTSDYIAIVDFTETIITDVISSSRGANQIHIYRFLHQLKEYLSKESLRNLGIRPSDDFVKSQLVLAMAHGVTLTLCKDNFIGLMDTSLNELFHTQMFLLD